ncbi:amidohydrolase [Microbacterium arabinogalactanolyticum]|uniref:amidohydrolase n=1 Tax=Microbacterium arabinogalactanolyticum TaxID=69365 RepID=UPI0025570D18|nr:amidohydrolase [Microbacterium arabinogalactanolyticum]GLC85153.1 amidohydrolase [Microbacterium arabinogalactanolyticum]
MSGHADLIVTGTIRTVDPALPLTSALAVKDGRIIATGGLDEIDGLRGVSTRMLDAGDGAVYPGFADVHNHHALAGRTELFELVLPPQLTLDQILDRVRSRARTLPADAWINGGVIATTLLPALSSTAVRHLLDEAAGGRPVMLVEDSRHNRWASTRALELAGVSAGAEGVLCDDTDGTPTGVLLEGASLPVQEAYDRGGGLTPQQHVAASRRGVELLNASGVTAFQDAGASVDILAALAALDRDDALNSWVVSSLLINDEIFGFDPIGTPLLDRAEQFRTPHHRPDFVKIFLDGVPPARTASFLEPYLPDTAHGAHFHGTTTMEFDELYSWMRVAAERGLGAKVHCTGDGSAHLVLEAAARLRAEGLRTPIQIAHGQFLSASDIPRLAELDVAADVSPFIWFPGVIPQALTEVLGERAEHSQPNRSLIDAGALVAGGSDWPVSESPNPLEGLQGLVTRADPLRRAPGVLWPEQAITAQEALTVFTLNAARAMGLGAQTGSLTPGKSADFVVLDRDAVAGPPEEIIDAEVVSTWFAGREVFSRH